MPFGDCFMSVCHAEEVGDDPTWAQRPPALFFHFLQHFLSSRVLSKAFVWRSVPAASLSSRPCSQTAASWQPPSVSSTPPTQPAHVHVQPRFSLHRLEVPRRPRVAVTTWPAGAAACCPRPSPCPPPVEAHLLCLAACANVGQGDTHTNPQLSRAGERISGIFHPRTISGVYLFCLLSTSEAS